MKFYLILCLLIVSGLLAGCGAQTSSEATQEALREAYERGRAEAIEDSIGESDVFFYDEASEIAETAFLEGYDLGYEQGRSNEYYDADGAFEENFGVLVSPSTYRKQKEQYKMEQAKREAADTAREATAETATAQIEAENSNQQYTSQRTPINTEFDYSSFDMIETPDSSAFSEIGYDEDEMLLVVVFRSSGPYLYYSVPEDIWDGLYNADSKGGYFNQYIKNEYICEKLK